MLSENDNDAGASLFKAFVDSEGENSTSTVMSSIQERLQLKRVPVDTWSIREKLCLASAVVRSGDQNWMSVSRTLKTVGDSNRPPDWYSQKSCAAQYGALLEHVETPKRKKRSSEGAAETPQESILKKLTQERIAEIQSSIEEMNQQYDQLKNEIYEARNPSTSEERIKDMWTEIEISKRTREKETARRAAWLKEREERRARAERTWRPPVQANPVGGAPSSPLLTSLLKSSPVVTTPQTISHPANVIDAISPSAGAPTLSMLLERSDKAPSAPRSASPENKLAAIEHIKSQLVQIERQLKEKTATPPAAALPAPAPTPAAVDIDDIEIKAEDVYAFRDIDIHIPPVAALHKATVRPADNPAEQNNDLEIAESIEQHAEDIVPRTIQHDVKEEPLHTPTCISQPMEVSQVDDVTVPPLVTHPALEQDSVEPADARIGFPTPEIKVISSEEQTKSQDPQVKDEDMEVDVSVEDVVAETSEPSQPEQVEAPTVPEVSASEPDLPPPDLPPPPPQPSEVVPEPPALEVPVEDIAAFAGPPAVIEIVTSEQPAEASVEVPKEEEEIKQESVEEKVEESIATVNEEVVTEEIVTKEAIEEVKVETEAPVSPKEAAHELHVECTEPAPGTVAAPDVEVKQEAAPEPQPAEPQNETDDDTPMEVSREEENAGRKRRDYSRKKKADSRTCSGSESAAEASAPDSPAGAPDAERQQRLWKKSVMLVYSRLCSHKYASLFMRPITDEEAPGYSMVIKRPMDLTTIRRNIESGAIRTTLEFQRDILLMLTNAIMYNSRHHSVYHMTKELLKEAMNEFNVLTAAHSHAGLAPAAAPPSRPKRRRMPSPNSTPT